MTGPIRDLNAHVAANKPANHAAAVAVKGASTANGGSTPAAQSTTLDFVHLRVHSSYSLLEGALPIPAIAKLCAQEGFPAVALTDTNNMFGALEFSEKLSAKGLQPIAGLTISMDFGDTEVDEITRLKGGGPSWRDPSCDGHLALLAATQTGYRNLMKLVSRAHLNVGDGEPPHISIQTLKQFSDGLIVLTGGPDGPIDRLFRGEQHVQAETRLKKLRKIFGDRLYIELQRHGAQGGATANEATVETQLIDLAYAQDVPLVATNQAYFATPDDYEAHDALICIADGAYVIEENRRRLTPEHFFKSAAQMDELFADLPEAIANTIEIAKRCHYRPLGHKPILPNFVKVADGASADDVLTAEAEELARQAREGLDARLAAHPLAEGHTRKDYDDRLTYELGIIEKMKFPGYFLIVADFIKWSKAEGIPVGPGRGSGAGSLVAYSLTITDLDPLRFGLLFERFLNPERVSMPDFDIDFCQDRREETIRYVQGKYGHDRVAQIITHGKLQARAVLRDVGRVLQMPYGQVDRLCKLVPNNPANPCTLPEALEMEPRLQEERDNDEVVANLIEKCIKLEGLYRHASTHAAGLVIGDRDLDELVPLYRDPKSDMPVTQFNWKLTEAAGLVKFDFLGLKTLTVLQKAVELVRRGRGETIDLPSLPLDDIETYKLLAKADTVGVFQLESTGMRESLKRLKPDRFDDIIAMVSLYRPGPMDNIPTYINRKHGEEPVDCLHPMLEEILTPTYGVIIYQEQVIQIAQVMGGYTLGQADLLRRAMGKKDKAEMARQQARFVEGALERGVKKSDATFIFELVNKFAGYGFNKSHAAAYALVSYHTAYMKAHYREEFLAASMTLDISNTEKLAMFAAEARRTGITVKPPCVNESDVEFKSEPGSGSDGKQPGAIRYALAALKNVGASAVETIVTARKGDGPYASLADFASRLNAKAMNKRGIEMLAAAGGFDCLGEERSSIKANADQVMALAQRIDSDKTSGTSDLFGGGDTGPTLDLRKAKKWTPLERLEQEFSAIGFYLSGHPLDQYATVLDKLGVRTYTDFELATERGATAGRLAGIVIQARERKSAKGNAFAFAMFSDATGQYEAVIFSDTLTNARELLVPGTPVVVSVEAERDGDTLKMRVQSVESLDGAASRLERGLRLVLAPEKMTKNTEAIYADIKAALTRPSEKGGRGGSVTLLLPVPEHAKQIEFKIPGRFDVSPNAAGTLAALHGISAVEEV
ncbi:MAG: DNA polymerase III subunit alpha [Pseudomonadota bacterium]